MADVKTCSDAARAAVAFLQRGWTRQEPAVCAAGDSCPCWHPKAVAWTTNGAMAAAVGAVGDDAVKKLYGRFRQMNGDHPIRVNHSQEDAILRLRACIEDGLTAEQENSSGSSKQEADGAGGSPQSDAALPPQGG